MGRISLIGTGNITFSGNEIYTTNSNDMLFGNNLIPTTISTFSIGSSANPFKTLFISASTLSMAAPPGGNSLSILNDGNNFQITNGGLRSQVIYTGGLLISGNNIGADPAVGSLPMTIGTNGLPALQILVPTSSTSTISTTNVIYASGGNSNQWGSSYTIVNQNSATTWNYQGTDLKALSGNWQGGNIAYTNLVSNSAAYLSAVNLSFLSVSGNWNSVYSTVQLNSATTWNYQGTDLKALSGNWQSTYSTVSSLSSNWAISSTKYLPLSGGTISGNLTVTGTTSLSTTTVSDGLTCQHIQVGNNGNQFSLFRSGTGKFVGGSSAITDTNVIISSKVFVQSIGITDDKKVPAISVVTSTNSFTAYSSIANDTSYFNYFFINP
jgi:hypothetical protein